MEVEQTRSGGSFAGSCRVQGKQIRADRGPRLKKGVLGLACLGRKEEAASLRAAHRGTGCKPSMGFVSLPHFTISHRTTAGIAAACAGDWSAAEQHHLMAITKRTLPPIDAPNRWPENGTLPCYSTGMPRETGPRRAAC